ncbi:partial 6-phosphogluconolactonase, partial [Gammaproteobacteria bacterium]
PPDSIDSNFNAANASLISKTDIPPENVYRIKGEIDPQMAAREYEDELASFFGLEAGASPPFDLALLGLGTDGHTLSLFPGTKALEEGDRLVVANHVPQIGSWRVTLTLKALREARLAVFLVSGNDKARAVSEALKGNGPPAARVKAKEILWLLDAGAAELPGA